MEKKELLGLFPGELADELAAYKLPAFRVKQVFQWLHRGAAFDQMTNLPKALREQLAAAYIDQPVTILEKRVSALDGTVKMLYALPDGNCVEGVLMRYHYGYTLCVSTQVGCRMGCVFCASTLNGCARNLTAAELLGQVHAANTLIRDGHV
ncbi:MAG: 23S rRNA (adenine(2503)-C(2))-methyltransferase RlmN, partial [Clostridia bacterium]|nr:23S rRNA (adenine(2503)-C(2))-methyltransferase RlmN [Clostridia bacterium]